MEIDGQGNEYLANYTSLGPLVQIPVTQLAFQVFATSRGISRVTPFGRFKPPILIRIGNRVFSRRTARFLRSRKFKAGLGGSVAIASILASLRSPQSRQTRSKLVKPCPECQRNPNGAACIRCRKRKQRQRYRM